MPDLNITDNLKLQPTELSLVSVPELGVLTRNLQKSGLSESVNLCVFNVPELRVGTLDQLIGLSDDILRVESQSEQLAKKLSNYVTDILLNIDDNRDRSAAPTPETVFRIQDQLKLNQGKHYLHEYIRSFRWDQAKYPSRGTPLAETTGNLAEKLNTIESQFRQKSAKFNQGRRDLAQVMKKQSGSLMTRDLSGIVDDKRHLVNGSEYLQTLLVAVHRNQLEEWNKGYETLADYVVPRSSQEIHSDDDHHLFTVTLFQRCVDEFKTNCSMKKFVVREYKDTTAASGYDQNGNKTEIAKEDDNVGKQIERLEQDVKKQFAPLLRWLKVNYNEAVSIMMHLKCLKCFIESVLRFGLPVSFEAVLLEPAGRSASKLQMVLDNTYKHLDRMGGSSQEPVDVEGLAVGVANTLNADYRPYVFSTIACDFVQSALGIQL